MMGKWALFRTRSRSELKAAAFVNENAIRPHNWGVYNSNLEDVDMNFYQMQGQSQTSVS